MTDPKLTPPPELVQQWWADFNGAFYEFEAITANVFQAGADQELEACIEWLKEMELVGEGDVSFLRDDRRPKPPSLKEQALELARPAGTEGAHVTFGPEELALIRRALEQLDD
jgi:hypothetical protein